MRKTVRAELAECVGVQMADGRWQMADGRWQMADGVVPPIFMPSKLGGDVSRHSGLVASARSEALFRRRAGRASGPRASHSVSSTRAPPVAPRRLWQIFATTRTRGLLPSAHAPEQRVHRFHDVFDVRAERGRLKNLAKRDVGQSFQAPKLDLLGEHFL